ncbi:gas vesicle protein GvpO [Jatrophihabitans sp.]|uniref:gas vesicle protein GvpO n=1 Tax=Jatrophihabitans sp. TaxID=1932789 RepID=UPI002BBFD076|nr:gas vesicle protein GvpO [Jatrophihabitans sp.]
MTQPRKRAAAPSGDSAPRKRTATSSGDTAPRKRTATSSDDTAPRKRTASSTAARNGGNRAPSPAQIARAAADQLTEISGVRADGISGLERTDDGWQVRVEVVEVARIPDSTSVMASYRVLVDTDGTLQSYQREHRYYRNQAGDS